MARLALPEFNLSQLVAKMVSFLRQYGYSLVFVTTFAENLGLPVPSYPLIVVGAALATELHFSSSGLMGVAIGAALLGDILWYIIGRLRGRRILRTLCSISLNPDSCVSRTENLFVRHGLKSLLVAKFLPGLNTVAPPLAGMLKTSPARFVLFDFGGTILWAGSAVLLGVEFSSQVERFLGRMRGFGKLSLVIVALGLVAWILVKWVERRRFYRLLERSRISAPDLKDRLDRGEDAVIVDLRSDLDYQVDRVKIRGALRIPPREFERRFSEIPPGRPVVMYCT